MNSAVGPGINIQMHGTFADAERILLEDSILFRVLNLPDSSSRREEIKSLSANERSRLYELVNRNLAEEERSIAHSDLWQIRQIIREEVREIESDVNPDTSLEDRTLHIHPYINRKEIIDTARDLACVSPERYFVEKDETNTMNLFGKRTLIKSQVLGWEIESALMEEMRAERQDASGNFISLGYPLYEGRHWFSIENSQVSDSIREALGFVESGNIVKIKPKLHIDVPEIYFSSRDFKSPLIPPQVLLRDRSNSYTFMPDMREFIDSNFESLVMSGASWEQKIATIFIVCIMMDELHSKGFAWHDMNGSNVLLNKADPFVTDLETATPKNNCALLDGDINKGTSGTREYLPTHYSYSFRDLMKMHAFEIDFFGLGVMLVEAISGESARSFSTEVWGNREAMLDRARRSNVPKAIQNLVDLLLTCPPRTSSRGLFSPRKIMRVLLDNYGEQINSFIYGVKEDGEPNISARLREHIEAYTAISIDEPFSGDNGVFLLENSIEPNSFIARILGPSARGYLAEVKDLDKSLKNGVFPSDFGLDKVNCPFLAEEIVIRRDDKSVTISRNEDMSKAKDLKLCVTNATGLKDIRTNLVRLWLAMIGLYEAHKADASHGNVTLDSISVYPDTVRIGNFELFADGGATPASYHQASLEGEGIPGSKTHQVCEYVKNPDGQKEAMQMINLSRHDVFALGICLFEVLTSKTIEDHFPDGEIDLKQVTTNLLAVKNIPEEFIDYVFGMILARGMNTTGETIAAMAKHFRRDIVEYLGTCSEEARVYACKFLPDPPDPKRDFDDNDEKDLLLAA